MICDRDYAISRVHDCLLCGEPGADVPVNGGADGFHHECLLYGVIGHLVGVCGCTGYPQEGPGVRDAARLAARRWEGRCVRDGINDETGIGDRDV